MIPRVPYPLRIVLGLAFISAAITIRVSAGIVSDALAAVARWIVPEHEARSR